MTSAPPSVRPRNRKQLVIEAAAPIFSERGYHRASMEDIAAKAGITAAALYRHFPNKYALFTDCANVLIDRLLADLAQLPPEPSPTEVLTLVARTTIRHRAAGGLYRWEARYLERPDRRVLAAKFAALVERVTEAIERSDDPEHDLADAALAATAALGAIGSITMHHIALASRRAERLLVDSALRVAFADPTGTNLPVPPTSLPALSAPDTRRAQIVAAAIPLFEQDGFANVSIARIAGDVGVAPSAIYRHYPAKVDILAAACLQAASQLQAAVSGGLRGIDDSRGALIALAQTYVAYSFEHTQLTSVAAAEIVGLPAPVQRPLVLAQREHIAIWEQHLCAVRPDLDARQARVLVHAGFGVVVEAGRRLRWVDSPAHRATVAVLLIRALGIDP